MLDSQFALKFFEIGPLLHFLWIKISRIASLFFYFVLGICSISGVAKPLPGGKKVPAEAFSFALQDFFENCIIYVIFRNLLNLVVNYTAIGTGIALDMV